MILTLFTIAYMHRVLANKVSIASRIDCFVDNPNSKIGELLKEQVEERLKFYEEGIVPRKNADVMSQAMKEIGMMDLDLEEDLEDVEEKVVVAAAGMAFVSPYQTH